MMAPCKINIGHQIDWPCHFFGWRPALTALEPLHHDQGVKFIGYLDDEAGFKKIEEPFVGFFHHMPVHPEESVNHPLCAHNKGLRFYLDSEYWQHNVNRCLGLFTLCEYTRDWLLKNTPCRVESIFHPFTTPHSLFRWQSFKNNQKKILLHPGNWVRNFNAFNEIASPWPKAITGRSLFKNPNPDIIELGFLPHAFYDRLINCNVVFQCYIDVAASNTIVECIAKNTPLVVNRLPAPEEYLGKDYPLFYETLQEAETILRDEDRILAGHQYLAKMDKTPFSTQAFHDAFVNSKIYQDLPSLD